MTTRQRVLSGMRPTGRVHLGNLLGALEQRLLDQRLMGGGVVLAPKGDLAQVGAVSHLAIAEEPSRRSA